MKTVIIREIKYLVVPEVTRINPCTGCEVEQVLNKCTITRKAVEHLHESDKCGARNIIYIRRTREAVRQYRFDRMVGRLEGAI
jgi:hypothetical protein